MKNKGMTLIEITITITILAILMIAAIAGLNPIYQLNKGKDATRKKDLKRIGIAFEEYYNDNGCYPPQSIVSALECRATTFYQLNPWPCDPDGSDYIITMDPDNSDCPKWFIAATRLNTENKNGKVCNYGVSSTSKDWSKDAACASEDTPLALKSLDPTATPTVSMFDPDKCDKSCNINCISAGVCQAPLEGNQCSGDSCFYTSVSINAIYCKVDCCGTPGCPIQPR